MRITKSLLVVPFLVAGSLTVYAADYNIDPMHSKVEFKVKHLGISTIAGRFDRYSGTFSYDAKDAKSWKTQAKIETASLNTDVAKRDEDVRSPNFLDTAKYPDMSFVSTGVKDVTPTGFKLLGNLTLHGVTKPVVLDTEIGGTVKDPWGGERAAFTASTTIDRRDYGIVWNKMLEGGGLVVGNDVKIVLEIEGVKQK